jgi:ketosteroid isomerase-like protein
MDRRNLDKEPSMSTQENVQIVQDFFSAISRADRQALQSLCSEDIEWIIPGEDWPLAGTHRGQAGLASLLDKSSEMEISSPHPPEFVAQGDRVMMVGFATGKVKATNRTFEDYFVFAFTIRAGKVTSIREYVDTQALARAAEARA